jgi:hypothetical protein
MGHGSTAVKYAVGPINIWLAPRVIIVAADAHSKGTKAIKIRQCWRNKLTRRNDTCPLPPSDLMN